MCDTPSRNFQNDHLFLHSWVSNSVEAAEKTGQHSVLELREDPRVIDTGISAAAKSVKRIPDSCGAHATRARAVVSISKMLSVICPDEMYLCEGVNASHSVPVKASKYGRSKEFAITIAQSQRAKCVRISDDPSIVMKHQMSQGQRRSYFGKTIRDSAPFQNSFVSIKEELRTQTTSSPVDTVGNSVRFRSRVFL